MLAAEQHLLLEKRIEVVLRCGLNCVVGGAVGLDDDSSPTPPPSCPARHLGEELERALSCPEVGKLEQRVGLDHTNRRHMRKIESFRDHLRADDDVYLSRFDLM